MRKIREVLRLRAAGKSQRQIAASVGIGQSTVGDYVTRARRAGVGAGSELDDAALERALYPPKPTLPDAARALPDWSAVHREYSWFCAHYRAFAAKVDLAMRQSHRAAQTLFVDYAGQTVPIVERCTGEVRQAQIFVAVLGASNYTFAEATWTQALPDWIASHQRAFAFIGGVTETVVTRAHRYEPDLNRTYAEMAAHYGTTVLPTRVAKPRDKAKVEVSVQIRLVPGRQEKISDLRNSEDRTCKKAPTLVENPGRETPPGLRARIRSRGTQVACVGRRIRLTPSRLTASSDNVGGSGTCASGAAV